MNLVSASGVSKNLSGAPLFEDARFGIESGERIGLVGPNGSGKSTLLALISGAMEPDSGSVSRKRGLTIAALPQTPTFDPGDTLRDFLFKAPSPTLSLVRDFEACLDAIHRGEARNAEYDRLSRRMEEEGGHELESRFHSLLAELGLPDPERPMLGLSGGMVKKAAVARQLAQGCELLLLDEPTNHLDLETIEWLEDALIRSGAAFVVVTHDRAFLDRACTSVWDIDRRALSCYPGSYADYVRRRAERAALETRAETRRLAILRDELEWLERGPQARGTKQKGRKDRIESMRESVVEEKAKVALSSAGMSRLGRKVLELQGVRKSYGGRVVLSPFDYAFTRGERIGVVGPNGSGKTTLLAIASGAIASDSGRVVAGETLRRGYFGQTNDGVPLASRLIDYVREVGDRVALADGSSVEAERVLERLGFERDHHEKPLSKLSGGELKRARFARLLLEAPNFLALDEPTNDLDIDTIGMMEDFLLSSGACLLVVSHDRAFLSRVTGRIFALDGSGAIRDLPGGYAEYLDLREAARIAQGSEAEGASEAQAAPEGEPEGRKKLSFAERREFERVEARVAELEAEIASLETAFQSGDGAEVERASRRYDEARTELETAIARWETLAERA